MITKLFGIKITNKKNFATSVLGFFLIPLGIIIVFSFFILRSNITNSPAVFHSTNRYHFSVTGMPFYIHYSELPTIPGVKVAFDPHYFGFSNEDIENMPFLRIREESNNIYFSVAMDINNLNPIYYARHIDDIVESIINLYQENIPPSYLHRANQNFIWSADSFHPYFKQYINVDNYIRFLNLHTDKGYFYNAFDGYIISYHISRDYVGNNMVYLSLGVVVSYLMAFMFGRRGLGKRSLK